MSPSTRSSVPTLPHFPRVSGDEPQAILDLGFTDVFSPRERG